MDKFLVIANSDKGNIESIGIYIKNYLEEREKSCELISGYASKELVSKDIQCVIVLGGDGTMLRAVRELIDINVSFIGINFGTLGFLAEVEKDDIDITLEKLINNEFSVEQRMMLKGQVIREGKVIAEDVALNDIVINRSGALRIMDISIYVNGMRLNEYKADGMILATPTGSTAYSMSAGGPIVNPSAKLTVMTPICPHTLNTRSIVLDAEDVIEIEVSSVKKFNDEIRNVYFDGDRAMRLLEFDKVLVRKSEKKAGIIKLSSRSFLEILGKKMGEHESIKA